MKKIIFYCFIATLFLTACDRDVPDVTLVGKWGVVNYQTKEWINGAIVSDDNYIGQPADYMEFKNDNTVSFYMDGFGLTVNYQVQPDNKVVINGDTYTIQSLTANSATLYIRYNYTATNYDEETINLKR